MAAPDPLEMQQQVEVSNIKALGEFTNNLVAGMGNITLQASQNYAATMDALNKQLVSNLDFANKIMGTRLEIDPVEAAATSVILQQAAKAAQTTPPVTP